MKMKNSINYFLIGMGSILGVFAPYFEVNIANDSDKADAEALRSDFSSVGQDIKFAIGQMNGEI